MKTSAMCFVRMLNQNCFEKLSHKMRQYWFDDNSIKAWVKWKMNICTSIYGWHVYNIMLFGT